VDSIMTKSERSRRPPPSSEPSIHAVHFRQQEGSRPVQLLSDRQRKKIADAATRMEVNARTILYREGAPAASLFFNGGGVVKTFRELPSGARRVQAFLFENDVFGLAENGRYVNTAQAITHAMLYKLPMDALAEMLRQDADLEYQFLCKVTHELRDAQHRAIVLARRDAPGRLAMFLNMLDTDVPRPADHAAIPLSMSRSDIAAYLGLSPEAVSRASRRLADQGLIVFDGRHAFRILDRGRFGKLVTAL
jgi:CRP/FNR family transcriptional regulator, anaerobic regulatory protein